MGNACLHCRHRHLKAKDKPCCDCLGEIKPGQPLVFNHFEADIEEQEYEKR